MPLHPEARADAPFYVVLNAGSGSADADVRSATIRDVLGAAGPGAQLDPGGLGGAGHDRGAGDAPQLGRPADDPERG